MLAFGIEKSQAMNEHKKKCQDELNLIEINQLHEATLQISKSCFEFKKICVGLIGISITVLLKLTGNALDHSYFIVPLLICLGFWVADFTAYFYQKSTRLMMSNKIRSIASRNEIESYPASTKPSWFKSAFNLSMSLYFVIGGLLSLGWVLFAFSLIG